MAVTSRVSSLGLFRKRVRGEKMSLLRQPMGGRRGLVDSRCSLHTATHSQTVLETFQQTELYGILIPQPNSVRETVLETYQQSYTEYWYHSQTVLETYQQSYTEYWYHSQTVLETDQQTELYGILIPQPNSVRYLSTNSYMEYWYHSQTVLETDQQTEL